MPSAPVATEASATAASLVEIGSVANRSARLATAIKQASPGVRRIVGGSVPTASVKKRYP